MARSSWLLLALPLLGCDGLSSSPKAIIAAPLPKQYTCEQEARAARELKALPADSMLRQMFTDYGEVRDQLRGALGLPKPPRCPPPVIKP